MSPEELEAIRDRAWAQGIVRTVDYYAQAHRDRAELLAEVDRLTALILPDPNGGCCCHHHYQDAGGGHTEHIVEYEPACPEHPNHVYDPRSGVWEFRQDITE